MTEAFVPPEFFDGELTILEEPLVIYEFPIYDYQHPDFKRLYPEVYAGMLQRIGVENENLLRPRVH